MRIAINELGGKDWTGGITYRNNLIRALSLLPEKPELFLIGNSNDIDANECSLIIPYKTQNWVIKSYDSLCRHFFRRDFLMGKTLEGKNIDILFPGRMPPGKNITSIYWIPDFQFKHLPHLYSEAQIKSISEKLNRYFNDNTLIVVSSQNAKSDLEKYFPHFISKVRTLSFVAHVPDNVYSIDPRVISSQYHLPEDFIYLPNQFWAHKNHILVLEALKILRDSGIRPIIVCSGNPVDSRNPSFFANLIKKISEYNLREQFILIGLVPHDHIYSLIRQSKCVLNPSLFEGWSTTVEESKSVGKRLILSDLDVHKEQDPAESIYFDRTNEADLAEKLGYAWLNFESGPDQDLEIRAQNALSQRMCAYGQKFIDICVEAANINLH